MKKLRPLSKENLFEQPIWRYFEADLPIIDAHHHLIDGPAHSYSIKNYLADCQSGHLIKGSVYIEVRQNYWKNGPAKLRPVGETEFVANLKEFEDNDDGRLTPDFVLE